MGILIESNVQLLWTNTLKEAENKLTIKLDATLEKYLISLLVEYTDKPEMTQRLFAMAFLQAEQASYAQRSLALRQLGDECLLFAGLFPKAAERRNVGLNYFVSMGRSAYASLSQVSNDLFSHLAFEFVLLMDVLQSIQPHIDLKPLEAYEQWHELGSLRAFQILQLFTKSQALKN